MTSRRNQLPRKQIEALLFSLGLLEVVNAAIGGDEAALIKLTRAARKHPEVAIALELLRPRHNASNRARRNAVSSVERAGQATTAPNFVQGGSPGLGRRK